MNALVTIVGDEARTDTMTIAEGMQIEHASVIKLVRKYVADLEEFGEVRFEIRPRLEGQHGGGDVEYALLNQEQFTLIGTYMKNTEIARAFKKRLVKAFFDLARKDSVRRTVESSQRPELEAAGIFEVYNRLGRAIGFDENMAAFSANNATRNIISVNVLELMGVTRLIAPKQVADFTPGQIGEQLNQPRSAEQVNIMLVNLGYQVRTKVKQCPYEPTEKGKPFCRMHDVPRANTAGTSQQLRWYMTILDQEDVQWATGLLQMDKAA